MSPLHGGNQAEIGELRKLKHELWHVHNNIPAGTEVCVVGVGMRGYDVRDPKTGQTSIGCGFDIFEPQETK